MIVIRKNVKFGIVMYPYHQEYEWFYFKLQGGPIGLEIVWEESLRPINFVKTEVSKLIIKNAEEMLTLLLIGEKIDDRSIGYTYDR